MWRHPIPMYRSISDILNLAGRLATGSPSKSSHPIPPSDTLICLILCSSMSMRAWVSFEVRTTITEGGGATSIWLCKVNGVGYGTVWPSREDGGIWVSYGAVWLGGRGGRIVGSYCTLSWIGTYWACCPSILWPILVMALWIEAIAVANWSTITTCESISVLYD